MIIGLLFAAVGFVFVMAAGISLLMSPTLSDEEKARTRRS
jgi:hypothetical protein